MYYLAQFQGFISAVNIASFNKVTGQYTQPLLRKPVLLFSILKKGVKHFDILVTI